LRSLKRQRNKGGCVVRCFDIVGQVFCASGPRAKLRKNLIPDLEEKMIESASDLEKDRLREELNSKDAEIKALHEQLKMLESLEDRVSQSYVVRTAEVRPRVGLTETDLAQSDEGTCTDPTPVVVRRIFDPSQEAALQPATHSTPQPASSLIGQPPRPPPWRVNATTSHSGISVATTPRTISASVGAGRYSIDGARPTAKKPAAVRALVSEFERRSSSLSRAKEPSPQHRPVASTRTASAPRTGLTTSLTATGPLTDTGIRGRGAASAISDLPMACTVETDDVLPAVNFGMSPMPRIGGTACRGQDEIQDQKGIALESMVQQRIRQLRGGS